MDNDERNLRGRVVCLLRGRGIENGRIATLRENATRAIEFHDQSFAGATRSTATANQTNSDFRLLVGSKEQPVVNKQHSTGRHIVTHNRTVTTRKEHATRFAVAGVHVGQEQTLAGHGSATAREFAGDAQIVRAGDKSALRQNPSVAGRDTKTHHIARERESEANFGAFAVGVQAARFAGTSATTRITAPAVAARRHVHIAIHPKERFAIGNDFLSLLEVDIDVGKHRAATDDTH